MNPLSPLTYYVRHKKSALVQITLISLATVGLFVLVGVLDAIPQRANVSYLTKLSRVITHWRNTRSWRGLADPEAPGCSARHPGQRAADKPAHLAWNGFPTDVGCLAARCADSYGALRRATEGRAYVRTTQQRVRALRGNRSCAGLGTWQRDRTHHQQRLLWSIPTSLVLVGILEGDPFINTGPSVRLGFISAEYLNSHELYIPRSISLLVVAREGRKTAVDDFLETTVRSRYIEVETYSQFVEFLRIARIGIYVIFGAVNSIASIVVAFVIGIINRIAITSV